MSEKENAVAWLENDGGNVHPITGNCGFGRSSDNQIVIDEHNVSRHHAVIHTRGAECWLADLGSKNGTLLNSRRVVFPQRLQDGDRIAMSARSFVFHQLVSKEEEPVNPANSFAGVTRLEIRNEPCWLLVADLENSTRLAKKLTGPELAATIGPWLKRCRDLVEGCGGTIDKYLGDGFLAYWREGDGAAKQVAAAVAQFQAFHAESALGFRVVVHHGSVALGRTMAPGEEIMTGDEVIFVFRMEKLAAAWRIPFCVSAAAERSLSSFVKLEPLAEGAESGAAPARAHYFRVAAGV